MVVTAPELAEKRRLLQLETLYDLALALHSDRSEQELVDELLQRVCAVLDPAAAVAVTRDGRGARVAASVGWVDSPPEGDRLIQEPLWRELLAAGGPVTRRDGLLAARPFDELLATPLAHRGVYLGYLALLDKEVRGEEGSSFSEDDRRFLDSVAVLAGVSLDAVRQVEKLHAQRQRLEEENKALKGTLEDEVAGERMIAKAPAMRRILEVAERVAPRGVNVLVRGESGTGKELVAKLLHVRSGRSGPLIAINCAALPESLLESELFGIEGGVATGVTARAGKFELADGGTLFLDEIGDMQPLLQAKLLRALEEREVVRVGGRHPIPFDVRLVAATHRPLEERVTEGDFREDLYYRLRGVEILLPPLRERREDVPLLVRHFAERFSEREGIPAPRFDSEALGVLMAHRYPGNVRELRHLVEGAASLADGPVTAPLLGSLMTSGVGTEEEGTAQAEPEVELDLAAAEQRHIERVLELTDGNKSAAARLLGIDRRTLQRKGF
jgi:transcriptional regulator with GAF, ATPase, and Fis domain